MTRNSLLLLGLILLVCCFSQPTLCHLFPPDLASAGTAGDSSLLSGQPINSSSSQYHNGGNDNGTDVMADRLSRSGLKTLINTTGLNHLTGGMGQHSQPIDINPVANWALPEKQPPAMDAKSAFNENVLDPKKTYISMQQAMRNLTRNIGAKAVFYCDIVGKPIPQIHWFKDQVNVVENPPKFRIETGLWGSSLRIDQVQTSDEGTYLCIATNPSGTLNGTARLRVTEKVKPNFVSKPLLPTEERTPPTENDGFCQDFHSNVCGKFLFGHRVYVTREFHQAFTETQVSKFLKLAASQPLHRVREDCLGHLMEAMCHYNFPLCLPVVEEQEEEAKVKKPRLPRDSRQAGYEPVHPVDSQQRQLPRTESPEPAYQAYYLCQQDCRMVKENECRTTYEYLESTILHELPGLIMNCGRLPQYSMEPQGACRRIGDHDVPSIIGHTSKHTPTDYWGSQSDAKEPTSRNDEKPAGKSASPIQLRGPLSNSPDFVPIFVSISALILFGILILGICFLCRRTRDTSMQLESEGAGIFRRPRQTGSSFGRLNSIPFDTSAPLFRGQGVGSSLDNAASKKRRVPGMGSGIKTSATARLLNGCDDNYCLAYTQVANTVPEPKEGKVAVGNGLQHHATLTGGHMALPSKRSPLPATSIPQSMTTYHQYEAANCVGKSLPPPNEPAPPPPPPPLSIALSGYQRSNNNSYSSSTATNPVNERSELCRQAQAEPIFSPVVNRSTTDSRTAYTTLETASPGGQQLSRAEQLPQMVYQFGQGSEQQAELTGKTMEYAISQLRFGKQFGQGVFGPVYKAELLPNAAYDNGIPATVIVKTLSAGSPASLQNDFKREAELISNLDHPNVLSLLGVSMQHPPWCMIFEIRQYLDLCELMSARRTAANAFRQGNSAMSESASDGEHQLALSEPEKLCVLAQVAAGMDYLSSHRFVHRDLAARNVIIVNDSLHCKITDLGLARDCYANDYYRIHPHSLMLPIRWMPLDSIIYGKFTVESDIWAFGVLIWEIWADGGRPYSPYSDTDVLDLIRARQLLSSPAGCPVKVTTFMHHCWADEPDQRPTFKDCIYQIDQWQMEGNSHQSAPLGNVVGVNSHFGELHSGHYSGTQQAGHRINSSNATPDFQPQYTSIVDEPNDRVVGDTSPVFANKYSAGEFTNDSLLSQCSPSFARQISHVGPDGSSANGIVNSVQCLPCTALSGNLKSSECPTTVYYDGNRTFLNFGIQLLPNTGNVYLPSAEPVI